jgi:hypothetical protein
LKLVSEEERIALVNGYRRRKSMLKENRLSFIDDGFNHDDATDSYIIENMISFLEKNCKLKIVDKEYNGEHGVDLFVKNYQDNDLLNEYLSYVCLTYVK